MTGRSSATVGDGDPVVAEFEVEHDDVVLSGALRAVPSVTVEPNYRTTGDRATWLVFTVGGWSLDEFDAALERDDTVRDSRLLSATDDERAYRVRYGPDVLRLTPALADLGAVLLDVRSRGRCWSLRARFPGRDAFASFREYCSANGATLELYKLYGAESVGSALGLAPHQWETLATAHEMGYFEVPRGATQEQIARRLGVSSSAVSQRIRRATNQLLAETLDSARFGSGL